MNSFMLTLITSSVINVYIVMKLLSSRRSSSPASRVAVWAGAFALLAGVAHGLAYLVDPNALWSGPMGLRKPAVFGVSIGLTLWSVAWIAAHLRLSSRLHAVILHGMSATLLIELAIIAGQRLRGVPSHFNLATPFDAALWTLMGMAIVVFALLAFLLAALAWRTSSAPPAILAGIRGGLLIFAAAQISGQILAIHGTNAVLVGGRFVAENLATAATLGAAGNLKLPHALALHAIQIIPLLAVLIPRFAIAASVCRMWIWTSALGFAGVVVTMQTQAMLGRAPTDLSMPVAMMLGIALALFILPWCFALGAVVRQAACRSRNAHDSQHA